MKWIGASTAVLALAIAGGVEVESAAAQEASNQTATEVEGVVVTARRRTEALQDVPVSVGVVDDELMEDLALDSPRDVLAQVPGVKINYGVGSEVADDVTIRGVGVARVDGSAAATGIYRNGVFIGNGSFFGRAFTRFDMFDTERVEVFRGPQGALWGRNAAGGAINLVTTAPRFVNEGYVKGRYEFEQDATLFEAVVNAALTENAAIRLSGVWDDREGGHMTVVDPDSPINGSHPDKASFSGLRGTLRVQPSDIIDAQLTIETQEQENTSYALLMHRPTRGDPSRFERRCDVVVPSGLTCNFNEPDGLFHVRTNNIFGNVDVDFSGATLSVSAVYTDRDGESTDEFDTFTYPGLVLSDDAAYPRNGTFERWGVDVLLTSSTAGRLRWLVGADYQDSQDDYRTQTIYTVFNATTGAVVTNTQSTSQAQRELKSASVYGAIDYDFTDRLTGSAELRVMRNEMDNFALVHTLQNGAGTPFTNTKTIEETKWTPVGTLTYRLAPGHKVYGRIATGFRPAGFEPRRVGGAFLPPYEAETLRSHEVGYKGEAGPFFYEVNAYYATHDDVQLTSLVVNDLGQPVSAIGNAGEATSYGLEAAIRARFDVGPGRLNMSLAASHNDGEVESTGLRLPQTRDYQANLTGQYTAPLTQGFDWFVNGGLQAEGGGFEDPNNTNELDDFQIFSGSIGVENEDWRFQLFSQNLFDEIYVLNHLSVIGHPTFTYNSPRTWGVELTRRW